MSEGEYARTARIGGRAGTLRVFRDPGAPVGNDVSLELSASLAPEAETLAARVAHLLDLDANPHAIDAHLASNGLRESVELAAGVRVPGAFDGFELTVRAILGQQVTVKGATTLMSRLTSTFGESIDADSDTDNGTGAAALTHLAPTADRLAHATVSEIRSIGLPAARASTILALATAVAGGAVVLDSVRAACTDAATLTDQLLALPGIGPWTAAYVAMRVAHSPDAFPASDIALRRAAGDVSSAELARMAERWRPWRAYASMRLWLHGAAPSQA